MRRTSQIRSDPCRVLMQDEHRKNVAEDHTGKDQSNAAQNEETTGAQWNKRFGPIKCDDWLTRCRIM
jgi:hypothetical protein